MEWSIVRLGDISKVNAQSYNSKDNWTFVNYLDTGNITKNVIDEIQFIDLSKDKMPSRAKRKVTNNTIIYSTVRPNQFHYGIIKSQPKNFLVSTGFTTIDIDSHKANPDYIYYFLTHRDVTEKLQAIAEQSTSAYPSIKSSDLEDVEVPLPPINEQRKIADILSTIDARIDNNTAINNNLAA